MPAATNNKNGIAKNLTEITSIPIIEFHFDAIKTPFIISIWILSASIAKIGN